ncbi:MAG TPA: DNA polymerase III subunit gamma/tau C-terminal domain-containing protein, partial [Thioalkalivibrio sp.]|nr:DNA polymerase III subunit gamma/tau C-terminal domain-containing protein [Thioalkalivibrio sp.]
PRPAPEQAAAPAHPRPAEAAPASAPARAVREPAPQTAAQDRAAPGPAGALDWVATVSALGLGGPALNLANHCAVAHYAEDELVLILSPRHETLKSANSERRLIEAVQRHLGEQLHVKLKISEPPSETPAQSMVRASETRQREAEETVASDELTSRLGEVFDAQVVPGSVKPV